MTPKQQSQVTLLLSGSRKGPKSEVTSDPPPGVGSGMVAACSEVASVASPAFRRLSTGTARVGKRRVAPSWQLKIRLSIARIVLRTVADSSVSDAGRKMSELNSWMKVRQVRIHSAFLPRPRCRTTRSCLKRQGRTPQTCCETREERMEYHVHVGFLQLQRKCP